MKALGYHIIAEYFECSPAILDDVGKVEKIMLESAVKARATVISSSFHKFNPHGVSGVVVIQESHLAIHTWPEHRFASVDIFTCGDSVDAWNAYKYLKEALEAVHSSAIQMNRGQDLLLSE